MPSARSALEGAVAYLELHIEQGPVLDEAGVPASAVDGCLGVRRSAWTITGRAGHAGATPMALRRDPVQAAAAAVQDWRAAAQAAGAVATTGVLRAEPPTPTAIPARVRLSLDLRHRDAVFARTLGGISHSREEDAREEDLVVAIEAFAALAGDLAK